MQMQNCVPQCLGRSYFLHLATIRQLLAHLRIYRNGMVVKKYAFVSNIYLFFCCCFYHKSFRFEIICVFSKAFAAARAIIENHLHSNGKWSLGQSIYPTIYLPKADVLVQQLKGYLPASWHALRIRRGGLTDAVLT